MGSARIASANSAAAASIWLCSAPRASRLEREHAEQRPRLGGAVRVGVAGDPLERVLGARPCGLDVERVVEPQLHAGRCAVELEARAARATSSPVPSRLFATPSTRVEGVQSARAGFAA